MKQEKTISNFWLYNYLPKKITSFLKLIRFEKPIGFLLLMWPCWFSIAIFSKNEIKLYIIFFIGSFCMRGVGCIVNDYFDRSIDKNISRTSSRPLANGDLSLIEAFYIFSTLLILSLIILLQLNTITILFTIIVIPLIIIYPLMKRITYWPQLLLGIIFSWGVLVASIQINEEITLKSLLLYLACIFWTLAYDTIYAYQDINDDIKMNLKSTAVLFGKKGKIYVISFYCFFLFFMFIAQNLMNINIINLLFLVGFLFAMLIFLNKWVIYSRNSSNYYFKSNNIIGLIVFLYLFFSN